jgi:Zn-dependent protease
MRWSIKMARIAGIELKIHLTFLIFLAWIAFSYYRVGGSAAAMQGTLFVVLLFLCVLLHELGHALTARRFGIRTPDITLLPIGGVARLERMPEDPKQEFAIAIAGPLVNVAIAAILVFALKVGTSFSDLEDLQTPRVALLAKLASVNIFLVLFNLIPAFPMDGGRVLRALLAMRMNYARATQVAASVGQGLAFVFAIAGLFWNPMLIFIALFVYLGASQESAVAQLKNVSAGLPVSEAMVTDIRTLPPRATVEDALDAVRRTAQHEFAVVDDNGRVLGILTRDNIIHALRQRGPATPVTEVMETNVPVIRFDEPLEGAFQKMRQGGHSALPVLDEIGRLMGLITAENIGEMMMLRSLRPGEGRSAWKVAHA